MNKSELIERITELKEQVEMLQNEAFEIADDIDKISDEWQKVANCLTNADSFIDDAVSELKDALKEAEEISTYEYATTYAHMAKHITNKILCNSIAEIDENLFDVQIHSEDYEPNDNDVVFQWYLTDCTGDDVEWLTENFSQVHFYRSEILELWVLGVCHFGTAWDYVMIETKIESCARMEGEE